MLVGCHEVNVDCVFLWDSSSKRLTVSAKFWLVTPLLVASSKCFQVLLHLLGALALLPPSPFVLLVLLAPSKREKIKYGESDLCSTAVCSYSPPWVSQVIFLALWPGMWFSLSWFLETDRQTVQSPELALQWCDMDSEVFKHPAIRLASTTLEADLQPCVEKRLYWRLPRGWGRKLNQTNLHCTAAMLPKFHAFLLKCGHYLLSGAMLFTKRHSVLH